MSSDSSFDVPVAIIGAGPAGLMAAEVLSRAGVAVHVFDALPSAGRKFLLAGKGGLNLTHSEPLPAFTDRYAERAPQVARWLEAWGPDALRDWAHGLGVETFIGTSGRVFPVSMKAAPLLRAWLHRLRHPDMPGAVAAGPGRRRVAPAASQLRLRCGGGMVALLRRATCRAAAQVRGAALHGA
jgi:predicted flavoprotein YhiN